MFAWILSPAVMGVAIVAAGPGSTAWSTPPAPELFNSPSFDVDSLSPWDPRPNRTLVPFSHKILGHDGKKTGGDTARVVVRKDTQNKHTAATMATKLTQCIVPPNRLASIISWGPSAR